MELMAEWCSHCGVEVWSYCLMPNHSHLIVLPDSEDAFRRGIGEAHRPGWSTPILGQADPRPGQAGQRDLLPVGGG